MFGWLRRLVAWMQRSREADKVTRRVEIVLDEEHLELIRWYAQGIDLTVEEFMFRAAMGSVPEEYRERWKVARSTDDLSDVTFELDSEFADEAAFDASNVFPFPPRPRARLPEHESTFDVEVDPTLKHPCLYLSSVMPSHLSKGEAEGSCQGQGGKPCFFNASRVRLCPLYKPKNLLIAHS